MRNFIALDIETTGLDPTVDRVLTVAVTTGDWSMVFANDDETTLLDRLDSELWGYGPHTLVTWNGGGFDLPFLAERFSRNFIDYHHLDIAPTGELSKYGSPMYDGEWHDMPHLDIAAAYKAKAAELGVKWSLKPVAQALGLNPIEADVSGGAQNLHPALRAAYCLSDAGITLALARAAT